MAKTLRAILFSLIIAFSSSSVFAKERKSAEHFDVTKKSLKQDIHLITQKMIQLEQMLLKYDDNLLYKIRYSRDDRRRARKILTDRLEKTRNERVLLLKAMKELKREAAQAQ